MTGGYYWNRGLFIGSNGRRKRNRYDDDDDDSCDSVYAEDMCSSVQGEGNKRIRLARQEQEEEDMDIDMSSTELGGKEEGIIPRADKEVVTREGAMDVSVTSNGMKSVPGSPWSPDKAMHGQERVITRCEITTVSTWLAPTTGR